MSLTTHETYGRWSLSPSLTQRLVRLKAESIPNASQRYQAEAESMRVIAIAPALA